VCDGFFYYMYFDTLAGNSMSSYCRYALSWKMRNQEQNETCSYTQELRKQPWEIRCPQPRYWIPARRRCEPRRPTSLVTSTRDIIQRPRIRVQRRVDEAYTSLADGEARFIDEGDDRTDNGR